jgi:NAD(P)H-quinone oxidoreductase subunit 5
LVILIGTATAIHGTIVGRASTDAKTSLAYATLTQVGIVFIEIGLGWKWLAIAHIMGNATVRTMQYLRAPSMLHDYHQMHSAIGSEIVRTGKQIEELLPEWIQLWLYRCAFDRGHLDTILDRWVISPLLQVSAYLAKADRIGTPSTTIRAHNVEPISVHGPAGEGSN